MSYILKKLNLQFKTLEQEFPGPDGLIGELCQTFKENKFYINCQEMEVEEAKHFPTDFDIFILFYFISFFFKKNYFIVISNPIWGLNS